MAYDNELKFALFKNDKGDNEKRPDYRGTVTVKGVEYKLSGWIADAKSGEKYIRGVAEVAKPKQGSATPPPAAQSNGPDEDVPF